MSLDDLAKKYHTDKSSLCHNYPHIYEKHLSKYIGANINFLEIGVKDGASLRMWSDYFVNGKINGIDIDESCLAHSDPDKNIKVHIGNVNDIQFLERLFNEIGQPDVIVDDGSHHTEDIVSAFESMFGYVKHGGLYIVEDLYCAYCDEYRDKKTRSNFIDYAMSKVNDLNWSDKNEPKPCGNNKLRHYNKFNGNVDLNYYEKYIKSISFYKAICIIEKDDNWI